MLTIKYNGYILYQLPNGGWKVTIDGQSIEFDSLSSAISRIDYWTK